MNDPRQEAEANWFAVELLMPERILRVDVLHPLQAVDQEEEVTRLARKYGVSVVMMATRLTELKLLGWV